jgi:metal-dependent amidase/aminoacylase/carboxypeptidase family protein
MKEETLLASCLTGWRRQLHAMPETGFEEAKTSAFVTRVLTALGSRCTPASAAPGWWPT